MSGISDHCGFILTLSSFLGRYVGTKHKLALLLDYDGTLAPIAPHPDLAILPPETRNVLERLSNVSDVYIAIISGRNVNNVKEMVSYCAFRKVMLSFAQFIQAYIISDCWNYATGWHKWHNICRKPWSGNSSP